MFEEPTQPTASPTPERRQPAPPLAPASIPQAEPADIFEKTEGPAPHPPVLKAVPSDASARKIEKIEDEIFASPKSSILKWVIIGVVIVVLAGLGYWAYSKYGLSFLKKSATTPVQENQEVTPVVNEQQTPPPPQPVDLDTDKDGLTDQEEQQLGTDINSPDTDQDGLSDAAEARVYKTNPLVADTDGDGYSDGQEIVAGYDPNNPRPGAKLMDLQTEIDKLKQ